MERDPAKCGIKPFIPEGARRGSQIRVTGPRILLPLHAPFRSTGHIILEPVTDKVSRACLKPHKPQNCVYDRGGGLCDLSKFLNACHQSINFHRSSLIEVLSIDVRCAPTAAPPSMRRSTSIGNSLQVFPQFPVLKHHRARDGTVPSSVQSTSKVACVRAEMGLNDVFPQSFTQISSRTSSVPSLQSRGAECLR